jgi:hypothetical protein
LLDFALPFEVVSEEVARHRDPPDIGVIAAPEKVNEQPKEIWIGGGDADTVPLFVALCPEQHAAGNVKRIASAGLCPSALLCLAAKGARPFRGCLASATSSATTKRSLLNVLELDVANPETY